ncbi:MAG TPA: type IV pilus secretin PilQ [Kofleriaceae bacterium]
MLAAVVCVAALAPAAAYAEGKNEIRAVAFSEDAGMTKVVVRGALTPTFTVYKLEKPSRVVIDVPQARLAEAMRGHEGGSVFTPSTWAVSTIAAQELDDGGKLVRVIVTMARPGRYDVKTEGNDVVVMVTARDPKPAGVNPEDILKAQRESEAAKQESASAKQESANAKRDSAEAKAEAERMKKLADDQAMQANAAKMDADRNKADAQRMKADAETARADAERMKMEAEKARADAAKTNDQATRAKLEAEAATKTARADAAKAQAEAQRMKAEAAAAREEVEAAKQDVALRRQEAEQARAEAARVKDDAAKSSTEIARARTEADAAKADAARARSEAKAAKMDADAAKASAAADKRTAEVDKQRAEQERADAMALQKDAKSQLAAIDKRAGEVQSMEDKARASLAAAQAREEAARESVGKAAKERVAAEDAADAATAARDRAAAATAAEKQKLVAEATAAEARLAAAKKGWDDTEKRRVAAETAANNAKAELDKTRTQLASVVDQRTAAEKAATEATRKRGEAEAAASDASRRRTEAETAAALASKQRTEAENAAEQATKQRSEAEQQRVAAEQMKKAAEQAAREADVAKQAADKQRSVAESAAKRAVDAKHDAEAGLETLMAKRSAAEKAANDLETRSKAEAKAQAAIAAAEQRKASDAEMAKFKADAQRLADDRKKAEDELADRRKAVASQQAEADRLKSAAAQARDSAEREEKRRGELAQQRQQEEQELADIKAQKAAAAKMKADPAPVVAAVAPPAPAAVVTKPAMKAAFIKDITFKGNDASGRIDLAMTGEGQISVGKVSAQYVELIIDNADLGGKLERKLDVSKFGSPVRSVSSFRDPRMPNRVRLVAELASPATPTVERDATGVSWTFASTNTAQASSPTKAMRVTNVPSPVVGGFGAASTPIAQQTVSQIAPQAPHHRKVYHGGTVDFDFKDAPMSDLLRTIAETGKVNIVVPDGIDAKVTVRLKKVPWDQALEVILASHGLWYRVDGNLYRIAPRKELDSEDEAENARREAMIKAEAPRTEVVPLNYASANELKPKLEAMKSPKGSIEVDGRTNALIITDVNGNREAISRLALQLDTQTPQISIEARIVEARSTFLRQFGIQWGGNATAAASGGNATGLVWPSSVGLTGGATDAQTPNGGISALPSNFAVNLPAAVGTGEGGALGMSLGSVGGNFNINLRLSALEDTGTVRIISAPKITVLNNKEATISQGVSIPISVVSAAGTQTQFVQADLALKVTPYVSQRDCAIAMDLQVTKNEPDFVNVGARGDPSILRKEAKTSMLVADGETSVLGGIYTRNTGLSYKKLPFLGDLPVIGWLFKSRRENDDRTEILVFITPKITNKALLRCQQ